MMGAPSDPTAHPDNQKAASWNAGDRQKIYQQPYIEYSPIDKPGHNPLEPVIHVFNTWSRKAETIARNIWRNRKPPVPSKNYIFIPTWIWLCYNIIYLHKYAVKTGPSVSEAAWGKVNLTAKAISEGGFESLFKQIFATDTNEKLKQTYACYLSTTTGPVAGTLYLSTARLAFCSDRPLSFNAPSGQEAWSYYKVKQLYLRLKQHWFTHKWLLI